MDVDVPRVNPSAGDTNLVPNTANVPDTGIYEAISPLTPLVRLQMDRYDWSTHNEMTTA